MSVPSSGAPGRAMVVAHRGFSAVAPENTLVAMSLGVAAGADACEFDVRATADGALVLMHDEAVDRTTGGHGRVADLALASIRALDAGSRKAEAFAGERVPTFAEALERLRELGSYAVVEVKARGIAREIARGLCAAGMQVRSTVISFDRDTVRELRAALPGTPRALLVGKDAPPDALAEAARGCGATIVDADYRLLAPDLVARLRGEGIEVWAWTVDDPAVAASLVAAGVTAVTTNSPYRVASALPR